MSRPIIDDKFDSHAGSLSSWYVAHNSYATEVLADRPLGFWRLNEKSGTTARGMMSTNVDGTYSGSYTQGATGPGIDGLTSTLFTGGNVGATSAALRPTAAFTIEVWFKGAAQGANVDLVATNTRGYQLGITNATGFPYIKWTDSGPVTKTKNGNVNVSNNVYHHLVGTFDGSTLTLFVDGAQNGGAGTAGSGAVDYTGVTTTAISTLNGQLANAAVYDTALSPARILAHYNAGLAVISSSLTQVVQTNHYDLRSFINTNVTVPYTMNDMNYWNVPNFNGLTMLQMNTGSVITTANETWTGGGVAVAPNAGARYMNMGSAVVTVGSTTTFDSTITENIQNDFNAGGTYNIDIVLRGFPAQAAAVHPDLTNSFVDFSSDAGYAAGKTDSLAFSSSALTLTNGSAGGQGIIRFTKAQLVNLDPTSLKHVRFRLAALGTPAGTYTFQAHSIRIYPSGRTFDTVDIDTRRGVLTRAVPNTATSTATGFNEWTQDSAPWFLRTNRVKNFTQWLKFNTGHAPTNTTGSNKVSLLARYNEATGEFIQVELKHNSVESRIRIYENFNEVYSTTAAANTLTDSTDYFMKVEVNGGAVKASLFKSAGLFPGALLYSTGRQTVTSQYRGYVGLWFQPYNYDFTLDYLRSSSGQIATLETSTFNTRTPLMGCSLTPKSSGEIDLMNGVTLIASGDASLSSAVAFGNPLPSQRIQRTGVAWHGGFETSTFLPIGNPQDVRIKGDIFVNTLIEGAYRVVLKDVNGLIAYIRTIPNLIPNKWINFDLLVSGAFLPGDYKLMIQQIGFYADSFYADNLQVLQPSLFWEASPNGGVDWYPFGNAIGTQYSAINFPSKGSALKLRASALDSSAWVQGYEIVPIYGYPGRT